METPFTEDPDKTDSSCLYGQYIDTHSIVLAQPDTTVFKTHSIYYHNSV